MPTSYIQKLAREGKGSVESLEKKWNEAKAAAADAGHAEEFDYITGIFKKMIKESTVSELLSLLKEYTDSHYRIASSMHDDNGGVELKGQELHHAAMHHAENHFDDHKQAKHIKSAYKDVIAAHKQARKMK